jgi:hypothetical protein
MCIHKPLLCMYVKRLVLSLDTYWLIIYICLSPKVAGVALDVIGNQVVLYHHTNIDGFLLEPLEY